jgi:hypothetical protein
VQKINLRNNARARWLCGVPMLLLAALCFDAGHDQRGITTIVFGACLAVIAIVLLAERRFLVVDAQSGRLSSKRGIFYPFTVASFAIADVKHIDLVPYTSRRNASGTGSTRYRLLVNGRLDSALTDLGDRWHARWAGERVCVALKVPFDNRVYGPHSVRLPNELDMSLAERWRRSGQVYERPSLPAGSPLVVDEIGPNVLVSLPAETHNRKLLALLVLIFAAVGVVLYSSVDGGVRWFLHLFFAMAAVFFALALLAFSGHSRLTFTTRHVSFRQGLSLFSRALEFGAIEELIPAPDGIDLVGDSGAVWIHWPETEADSEFLQAHVAYEIARRTPVAADCKESAASNL